MPDIRLTRQGDNFFAWGMSRKGIDLISCAPGLLIDDIEAFIYSLPKDIVLIFTPLH